MTPYDDFLVQLQRRGWAEVKPGVEYQKGDWEIVFDTSRWMEISTATCPRLVDIEVPEQAHEFDRTIDRIEERCSDASPIKKR